MYRAPSWTRLVVFGFGMWMVVAAGGQHAAPSLNRAAAAQNEGIDFNRARELMRREQSGQTLSAEESEFLNRAKAAFRAKQGGGKAHAKSNAKNKKSNASGAPPRATTGLVPLTEMTADADYHGQDGGLYGDGQNAPPPAQLALAMAAAARIEPLDAAGRPSATGKIGLLSIGMSNTTQEYSAFMRLANTAAHKSPAVALVDGAQGGQAAAQWADPEHKLAAGRPSPWNVLEERLSAAGVSPEQVQVVWLKQADISPAQYGEFPKHADVLKENCAAILHRLVERFPNVRLCYLSSRIYAGWANTGLNPEPYAYEGAFAFRSLIQDQMAGEAELNCDPARGEVVAPVLLWGPYLWADGEKPREDGLTWTRADLGPDGTHPSDAGRQKVAKLLLDFFTNDPTSKPWFAKLDGDKK